jgi:fructose-bisphosphate aldolase, class II
MLLSPIQARGLIEYCIDEKFALLAVNADSHAAIHDCLKAAKEAAAPIIIETSMWQLEGISFGAGNPSLGMAGYIAHIALLANSAEFKDVPVLFHTDHMRGPETEAILTQAIKGFPFTIFDKMLPISPSTISLDAAKLTPEENIRILRSLIETSKACSRPITLEMEAGLDGGLTTPEETKNLIMGVEKDYPGQIALFAPGLGNQHGFSKDGYPGFVPENVSKSANLLKELAGRKIGVVLHGSSGLSDEQVQAAVAEGLTKMNWSTSGLILRSAAAREFYVDREAELTPGHKEFKESAMDNGVGSYVSGKFVPEIKRLLGLLGGTGKAPGFMQTLK